MNESQETQPKPEAGLPLGAARCYATFELANQETVTPCHLQRGHEGDHEGWCIGSKAHWPRGFISEYEFQRALDAEIVRTKIEMLELEKDLSHNLLSEGEMNARDYSIALQRAIEHHCSRKEIPDKIASQCHYHARKLNVLSNRIRQLENELRYCLALIETNIDCSTEIRVEYAKTLVNEVHA